MLAPRDDIAELSAAFRARGRVVIQDFLDPSFAEALHRHMSQWREWALVTIVAGVHRNFDSAQMEHVGLEKRAQLDGLIAAQAASGFQYLFDRYPLADPACTDPHPDPMMQQAREFLDSKEFLGLMRQVTGLEKVRFADGQMTRYRRGHFLTLHGDEAEGKNRLAAYVLGLTRDWVPDEGGQLQFIDRDGEVEQVVTPRFNSLVVFRVPTPHLVSPVAPFTAKSRLSITGWLRY